MAKVVIVCNEHPTEVVALYHARKVAKILHEKYGHKVVIQKFKPEDTNFGILQSYKIKREEAPAIMAKLKGLKTSRDIADEAHKKHDAFAFNFHCSHIDVMGKAGERSPSEFEIGEWHDDERRDEYPVEIAFEGKSHQRAYTIEVPAAYDTISGKRFMEGINKIDELSNAVDKAKMPIEEEAVVRANLRGAYHWRITHISDKRQKKYLEPVISEKIAAAIHEKITKK